MDIPYIPAAKESSIVQVSENTLFYDDTRTPIDSVFFTKINCSSNTMSHIGNKIEQIY